MPRKVRSDKGTKHGPFKSKRRTTPAMIQAARRREDRKREQRAKESGQ
jgi:hypothetical protein